MRSVGEKPVEPWRRLLEARVRQAADALSRIDGVLGLVLSGGVGRDEAWPLSDIDVVPIYEDKRAETAAGEVEDKRNELLDWWAAEGHCTCLDVGKLRFTRTEVERALALSSRRAARLLDDPRWFHSMDKAYRGKAVFDPEDLAEALSRWFTEVRFTPEVVRGRFETHLRQAREHRERATRALDEGDVLASAVALRESLHALTRYFIEAWGGRDNSFGRFGTRFERAAAERGEGDWAAEIMALYGLSPGEVARRMSVAPQGTRHRHRLSLESRRLIGEPVTKEQDARDVLLAFATREVRYRSPPSWPGTWPDTDCCSTGCGITPHPCHLHDQDDRDGLQAWLPDRFEVQHEPR